MFDGSASMLWPTTPTFQCADEGIVGGGGADTSAGSFLKGTPKSPKLLVIINGKTTGLEVYTYIPIF